MSLMESYPILVMTLLLLLTTAPHSPSTSTSKTPLPGPNLEQLQVDALPQVSMFKGGINAQPLPTSAPRCVDCVVSTIGGFVSPVGVAYDPLNQNIYVTDSADAAQYLDIISGASNKLIGHVSVGAQAVGDAVDLANGDVYVSNANANNVTVVSTASNRTVANISVGAQPFGVTYDSGNGDIYVASEKSDNVSVISGVLNRVVTNISVGAPSTVIAYDPANANLYVATADNVSVISGSNNTVLTKVNLTYPHGASGVAYDQDNGDIYLTDWSNNSGLYPDVVDVISGTTNRVVAVIQEGAAGSSHGPFEDAYDPLDKELLVTDVNSNDICVISTTTNQVDTRIPLGGSFPSPEGLAVDTSSSYVYVADLDAGQVSVVAPPSPYPWIYSFTYSPSPAYLQPISINVSVTGGAPPYSYAYQGLPPGCTSLNASNFVCTPILPGNYSVTLNATDTGGNSTTANLTVYVQMFTLSLSASTYSPRLGQVLYLNSTLFGDVPPYTYAYSGLPPGCASANTASLACAPAKPGNYTITVNVTDAHGNHKTANLVLSVAMYTMTFGASNPSPQLGQITYLNTTVNGDIPPYTYAYSGLPPGCTTANASSLLCAPDRPGNYTMTVNVTDAHGNYKTAATTMSVPMFTVTFGATLLTDHLNETTTLNVGVVGDVPPYSYSFVGLPSGCAASNTSSLACTPTTSGSYSVLVTVTDAFGNSKTANLNLVVLQGPTVTIVPERYSVDANESILFHAMVSGGAAPYAYAYFPSVSGAGCVTSTGPELNCMPSPSMQSKTFSVSVRVTDAFGLVASYVSASVEVYPALNVTLTASSTTPLLVQTVAFTANASGGDPPYNYSYLGLPYGCYSENKSSIGCLPTQSDWYNITVVVKDMNNGTAKAMVTMHVIFDFNVVIPASTPVGRQLTIMVNTNETFNGSAINKSALIHPEGGYGTFTYAYSGLPPGCASADVAVLTCTPTQTGKYSVTVSVHDQAGDHQTHTVFVNIVPANGGGPLGLPGYDGYILVGVVVAIVLTALAFLSLRKRGSTTADLEPKEELKKDEVGAEDKADGSEKGETKEDISSKPE